MSREVEYRSLGCVGYENYLVGSDGSVCRKIKSGIKPLVECWEPRRGYSIIVLSKNGIRKTFTRHRLVLEAFVGPKPEGKECCHNDGNPRNNHITNLRWDTHTANQRDRIKHGTHVQGENNPAAKITPTNVQEIRRLYKTGKYTCQKLGVLFGLSKSQTNKIINNKVWGCLPKIGESVLCLVTT